MIGLVCGVIPWLEGLFVLLIEADVESVDRSVEVARMKKPCSRELLL